MEFCKVHLHVIDRSFVNNFADQYCVSYCKKQRSEITFILNICGGESLRVKMNFCLNRSQLSINLTEIDD